VVICFLQQVDPSNAFRCGFGSAGYCFRFSWKEIVGTKAFSVKSDLLSNREPQPSRGKDRSDFLINNSATLVINPRITVKK
jgi:hypothetical protein